MIQEDIMSDEKKLYLKELAAAAAGIIIALSPPPAGLEQRAMYFAGITVWTILNWILNTMPAFAPGLLMLALFDLTKTTTFAKAFSSFHGTTVWLVLAVLLIGTAISKSGLLFRLCLMIMSIFPPTFRGQAAALIGAGIVIGPTMPSIVAKTAIAGPFATRIGELLGFEKRSRGMNGMFLAMVTGFALLAPMFITCSIWAYQITGFLSPEEAVPFSFGGWFRLMLPWTAAAAVLSYLAVIIMYSPKNSKPVTRSDIQSMLKSLGPMKRDEKITAAVLSASLILWILERKIGVAAVTTALIAAGILIFTKVIGVRELKNVNWDLIIFIGASTAISAVIEDVGMDIWLADLLRPVISPFASNPYIFITAVSIAVLLVRFAITSGTAVIVLFMTLLTPVCHAAGISPWIVGITTFIMNHPWFVRYQNPSLNGAFDAAGGDDVLDFNAAVPFMALFHVIALIGLFICVPFWKNAGLLP